MSIATYQQYLGFVKTISAGKHLPDAIYLHKCTLPHIGVDALLDLLRDVETRFEIAGEHWNVLKLAKRSFKITLLHYPRFMHYAYPELSYSYTVDLQSYTIRKADYSTSENPPILHRKETFIYSAHPSHELFQEITREGVAMGLYENTKTIGFKKSWEKLIYSKGCYLDALGRLHHKPVDVPLQANMAHITTIDRHKTAIDRNKLSTPMQILGKHGYFDGNYSVLDYGCGKGDDVRELEAHGIEVKG